MFTCLLADTDVLTVVAAIVVATILLAVGFLWYFFFERSIIKEKKSYSKGDDNNFIIYYNRFFIGTAVFFVVFCGVAAIACSALYLAKVPDYMHLGETVGITCAFLCITVIFAILVVVFKRWRVLVNGEKIVFQPSIGKRREFTLQDICKVERVNSVIGITAMHRIYLKDCKKPAFVLNGLTSGGDLLIKKLQKSGKIFL